MTNRRTHTHADFEDFSAGIKVVVPMEPVAMVLFDVGDTGICSRIEPKSVAGVRDTLGFTIDKSWMHPVDPELGKVLQGVPVWRPLHP